MIFRRNPHHCILPPYLLREISKNGTLVQQERARQNLLGSTELRRMRAATSGAATADETAESYTIVKERLVYDAENGSTLPGVIVRGEGDPPSNDIAVNEAYDGAGATYDLFRDIYGRNSIDDRGMSIDSTVHYRVGYDNAFWDGQQMVYGDGDEDLPEDQRLFNRFTISVDIMAHELTHGITQFEAGLLYQNQPGALNESISDVFAILVRQYLYGESAEDSDWLVGKDLLTANVNGKAIRSLKEPGTAYDDPLIGKDPQPGHMDRYVETTDDAGGVHINSGIPNHAFYVAAINLGGNAWEKAGRIWYVTMVDKLSGASDFQDAADYTYTVAGDLYGVGSLEQQAIRSSWSEVGLHVAGRNGVGTGNGSGSGTAKSGCLPALLSNDLMRRLRARA